MQCSVGERGQVTIPNQARDALGLVPGMRLEVSLADGALVLRKPGIGEVLEAWEGTADNPYGSTDEFVAALRDPDRDRDREL